MFREILDHDNAAEPGPIHEGRLDASYRSGSAVMAMVNRVFGDAGALAESAPPIAVVAWAREWRAHVSAKPALGGRVEWHHADDEVGRFAETLKTVRETEALACGLEVAVWVWDNKPAAALAEFLRRERPVAESDLHVAMDNPLTVALRAWWRRVGAAAPAGGAWSVQAAKEDEAGKGGEDEHAGQRVVYPRVVAMLVGISPERVMCEVGFTRLRRRVLVGF